MKKTKRKKDFPLISIVMNCHNGEKYLKESIKSVLKQSYQNWELIFWDNKSNDKSIKIIKSFKEKRIKCFSSKKYHRLYKARNFAIKKTRGKYISFLDVDDKWDKKFLHNHSNELINRNCDLIFSKYTVLDIKKKCQFINERRNLPSGKITQNLLNKYNIGILAVMIKKELFNNYRFDGNYQIIGDFDFFIKLSMKYKFCSLNYSLAKYRIHDTNFSNKNLKLYLNELNHWFKKNKKKLEKNNFSLFKIRYNILKLGLKYYLKKFFLNMGV